MANVMQLARCILDKQGDMTTMKLQKLCYYCQAWSMAWDERPIIEENFEAWANGPVCPELFERHQGKYTVTAKDFRVSYVNAFDEDQEETIDKVLEYYGDKAPHWLSELTHMEEPWRNARKGCAPGERCNAVISLDDMQQYYGGL